MVLLTDWCVIRREEFDLCAFRTRALLRARDDRGVVCLTVGLATPDGQLRVHDVQVF